MSWGALGGALVLIAIILLGQVVKLLGWLRTDDFKILATLVFKVTLPAAVITSFNGQAVNAGMFGLVLIGLVVNLVLQLVGYCLGGKTRKDRAFGLVNLSGFNIGAFAVPFLLALVGPQAVIPAVLFDIGNSLAIAGLGYATAKSLAADEQLNARNFGKQISKSIIFWTGLLMLLMAVLGITLPAPIIAFTSVVGAANPFLAMLMIGVGLDLAVDKRNYATAGKILAVRYAILIALAALIWLAPWFDAAQRAMLTILLAAPIVSMVPAVTAEIDGDVQLSSLTVSASILVSIIVMPILAGVLL